jgi:predicted metal-dependent peptidase
MLTTSKSLTAEQRIERSHIELMKHPHFVAYSGVLMVGSVKVKEADECPTAYTNGRDVVYGRDFLAKLDDADVRGLILHENKHKMYRHLATWQHLHKINPSKANKACDYVINLEIDDEGKRTGGFVSVPEGGLLDEQYRGLNAQEVFHKLQDDDDEDGQGGSGGGLDEHGWEEAQEMSAEEADKLGKEIDQAIRQGAILAGKVKGTLDRSFTDLLSAKVDWKEALREFVSSVCSGKDESTWRKPNRRWLQHDIYMPSTVSETMGRVVVAIDTSGSIDDNAVNRFLSEVVAIMDNVNPEMVDLIYWGSDVVGHEVYGMGDADRMKASTKPVGGGGTSPSCITAYLKDKNIVPECAIVLTDGYVGNDWGGHWTSPVLWAIVGGCKDVPTVGSAIYVEE